MSQENVLPPADSFVPPGPLVAADAGVVRVGRY